MGGEVVPPLSVNFFAPVHSVTNIYVSLCVCEQEISTNICFDRRQPNHQKNALTRLRRRPHNLLSSLFETWSLSNASIFSYFYIFYSESREMQDAGC